ncbi:MAG: zinc-dependent metalloprotease [Myxococcales bacterium]|nr:zinc-dependent metalloprotease [Myxococcales bacterium]USN51583.1 MAG: zinc-dependent metalloprotease [Myxococcales bacterium]
MPKIIFLSVLLLFNFACSKADDYYENNLFDKEIFNSQWKKQGVSTEPWYYRMTVIDAPINTQALGIAEGHVFHPDVIKWEITKNLLIAWRSSSKVQGLDLEDQPGVKDNYRGAPLLAFFISAHFDYDGDLVDQSHPWHQRRYMQVDWSKNIVNQLKRKDRDEGITSLKIESSLSYVVDQSQVAHPNKIRIDRNYIDITTRHPIEVSKKSALGIFGSAFKKDTAAPVIDIRHSFLKKSDSDFIPLPLPKSVIYAKGSELQRIAIDDRIGLFKTGINGRGLYDRTTGILNEKAINNAILFNIWKRSLGSDNKTIAMKDREIQPIIYYTNVLHPEELLPASNRAIGEWNEAFRKAIFHAQKNKYRSITEVPSVMILKENSCNYKSIRELLSIFSHDEINEIEKSAKITLGQLKDSFEQIKTISDFDQRYFHEINAKSLLERLCTSLEFHTRKTKNPFVYQRLGDLRFNLINIVVDGNITQWSGYGPMFSDPDSGEIISATAHINLKYIDKSTQKLVKKISLLKSTKNGTKILNSLVKNKFDAKDAQPSISAINELNKRISLFKNNNFSSVLSGFNGDRLAHYLELNGDELNLFQSSYNRNFDGEFNGLSSKTQNKNTMLMDPVGFIAPLAMRLTLNSDDLSEEKQFNYIREQIFSSVLMHEIGHNLGLKHNMAASSDALNYSKHFWNIEYLPKKIKEALAISDDDSIKKQLRKCLSNLEGLSSSAKNILEITTQECLGQRESMYSSVMDYHASPLGAAYGLGHYDNAAIMWAYTQQVEVFPKENFSVDPEFINIKDYLKYDDYREIPKKLFKDQNKLHERSYVKFDWNNLLAKDEFPSHAVPYAFCDESSAITDPKCLSFDVGPDMKTAAQSLKESFWTNFIFNYLAKDESFEGQALAVESLQKDLDTIDRFSHMLRWFHYYANHDSKFRGSFLERDYLSALVIGINHLSHIIALPEPGGHISAPQYFLESDHISTHAGNRLAASNILIPFNQLDYCDAKSISMFNRFGNIEGRNDYHFVEVPLGVGRPFKSQSIKNIDDKYIVFAGSSLIKKYALYKLVEPLGQGIVATNLENKDLAMLSWYQLFPQAVSTIYNAIINNSLNDIAFILDGDNKIIVRNLVDEENLKLTDYGNVITLIPSMDKSIASFALNNAVNFITNASEMNDNFAQSISVYCHGCRDEIQNNNLNSSYDISQFTHLSGYSYQALKFHKGKSLAANLLEKARYQKEYYEKISRCLVDENFRNKEELCKCVKTRQRMADNEWLCCDEDNPDCPSPILENIGEESCSIAKLELRQKQIKNQLQETVSLIQRLRQLNKKAN